MSGIWCKHCNNRVRLKDVQGALMLCVLAPVPWLNSWECEQGGEGVHEAR